MALTVIDKDAKPPFTLVGGLKGRVVEITFDSSYATGGEALTAADCGMSSIVQLLAHENSGRVFEYDYANSKLKAYQDAGAAAALAEVPNATNLATVVTRALVIGT